MATSGNALIFNCVLSFFPRFSRSGSSEDERQEGVAECLAAVRGCSRALSSIYSCLSGHDFFYMQLERRKLPREAVVVSPVCLDADEFSWWGCCYEDAVWSSPPKSLKEKKDWSIYVWASCGISGHACWLGNIVSSDSCSRARTRASELTTYDH